MKTATASGTWADMGRDIGVAQRASSRAVFARLDIPSSVKKILPAQAAYLRRAAADQFDWIRGYANGIGESFERVLALVSWEYETLGTEHCTTILGKDESGWFVAHNEDDDPFWRGKLFTLTLKPKGGVPFTALQYPGSLPGASIGVNRAGLAVSMDNLVSRPGPPAVGLPMGIVGCRLLQAGNFKKVLREYRQARVNTGMHFLAVGRRQAVSMELFSKQKARAFVKPGFAHSNHALFVKRAASGSSSSRRRLANALAASSLDQKSVLKAMRTPIKNGGMKSLGENGSPTLAQVIAIPSRRTLKIWES